MSEAKVVFNLDGVNMIIKCLTSDKMKDICQKFATIAKRNINSLIFYTDKVLLI